MSERHSSDHHHLASRLRTLAWVGLFYVLFEGAAALVAGILSDSVALVGFGIDSLIEVLASITILWRFAHHRVLDHGAEEKAARVVAWLFFLLAPYITFESVRALLEHQQPDHSLPGILLAALSLVVMPILGTLKQRLARQLGSSAAYGDGRQNILCAYLAGAVLVGLLGNAVLGLWWLDAVAGLFIAAVAVREGWDTLQGKSCGCIAHPQLND